MRNKILFPDIQTHAFKKFSFPLEVTQGQFKHETQNRTGWVKQLTNYKLIKM